MLQVKSFSFSQDTEVNELLAKYRLAAGASVFVSNGELMVPIEDGEPANNAQKSIDIKIQKNELLSQKETILHSIEVVKHMTKQLEEKLLTADADLHEIEAKFKSAPNNKKIEQQKLDIESNVKHLQDQIRANGTALIQNEYEIDRIDMNVRLFDKKLEELK